MVFYFWLLYDPSVPSPSGRVNNIGLLQDRQNGLLVGLMILGIGVAVRLTTPKPSPGQTVVMPPVPLPPTAPPGYTLDPMRVMHYPLPKSANPSMSRPIWQRHVAAQRPLSAFRPRQLDWGWQMNIAPEDFPAVVDFIEAYRAWSIAAQIARAKAMIP